MGAGDRDLAGVVEAVLVGVVESELVRAVEECGEAQLPWPVAPDKGEDDRTIKSKPRDLKLSAAIKSYINAHSQHFVPHFPFTLETNLIPNT